jgi:putative tryptophan/tyrosine transport system substrate-binding protein
MDRRTFVGSLAGGLLVAPLAAAAPPAAKTVTVGFVEAGSRSANQHFLDAFRQGLRDLKYIEGQSIFVEDRWADGRPERFPELIADLIRLQVDVLVVASTPGADAAKKITSSVPVVFWGVADPAGTGVVASLGHPGGNITGVALGTEDGLAGKWAELLKELVPNTTQLAVLGNPNGLGLTPRVRELRAAAATLKVTLHIFEVRSVKEFEGAFNAISKTRAGGLVVVVDPLTLRYRENIVRLAAQTRLPAVYGFGEFVRSGGLIAYGPRVSDQARRAAVYVDKILNGVKPADLPVEQPAEFELVINLKTARALGLTVPPALLQRADQIIE